MQKKQYVLIAIIFYAISSFVVVDNLLVQVIINIIICVIVPNSILLILFRKTENFKYFKDRLLNIKIRYLQDTKTNNI